MKHVIIKIILVLIFIVSIYFVFEFGSGIVTTGNGFARPGYIGGAIGFALISSAALLGFIYYECNSKKKNQPPLS
jgi:amino acid transporter